MGYDPDETVKQTVERAHHLPVEDGPSVFVNRINNGYIIQCQGRATYCKDAEDISGVVVATFAKGMLVNGQFELFDNSTGLGRLPNRPLNQPIV